jgi:hypothetical protein
MLVLLVFGFCGYVLLKTSFEKKLGYVEGSIHKRIDGVEASLNKRIDNVEASLNKRIDDLEVSLLKTMDEKMDIKLAAFHAHLKANDFAHLNNTIEALTFRCLNQNSQN